MERGKTKYIYHNTRIYCPFGEMITATKISLDIPDYMEINEGVTYPKYADITGSMTVKVETLNEVLTPMALAAGSWQDMEPFKFINIDISPPDGSTPLVLTLVNTYIQIGFNEFAYMQGGPVEVELKLLIGNLLVNGASILKERSQSGV